MIEGTSTSGPTSAVSDHAVPAPSLQSLQVEPVQWWGLWIGLALVVVAFGDTLVYALQVWMNDPEYSHGFLMPVVALWVLWERRERLNALCGGTSLLAVPAVVFCVLVKLTNELDFVISLGPFAFVGALGAVILAFLGWRGLGIFMPVLIILLLACPLPGPVQQKLTLPLKEISSQLAVGLLQISGIPTVLDGTMIHLEGTDSLWVADACSGIRSFISLLSIAVVACLVWNRHWSMKLAVVLAAIPIAVLVNGLRIWFTGWLSVNYGPEAAEGAFHFFEGFALFAVAGVLLLAFAALLGKLFPRAPQ